MYAIKLKVIYQSYDFSQRHDFESRIKNAQLKRNGKMNSRPPQPHEVLFFHAKRDNNEYEYLTKFLGTKWEIFNRGSLNKIAKLRKGSVFIAYPKIVSSFFKKGMRGTGMAFAVKQRFEVTIAEAECFFFLVRYTRNYRKLGKKLAQILETCMKISNSKNCFN